MTGLRTGLGVVFGAALGMLVGVVLLDGPWLALTIGAAVGLVAGAIAESSSQGAQAGGDHQNGVRRQPEEGR